MKIIYKQRLSSLIIQLTSLALSISLSTSRLHDVRLKNSLTDALTEKSSSPLTSSTKIPSLRKTNELAHLSSMIYYMKSLKAHDCTPFDDTLQWYTSKNDSFETHGATYHCHFYEHDEQDTQVLIVSRTNTTDTGGGDFTTTNDDYDDDEGIGNYVAVVYAGTDDFRTVLADAHTIKSRYGPVDANGTYPLSPSDNVRVHKGFNNQVFRYGLMDRVLATVKSVMMVDEAETDKGRRKREILTTGHSLGGADSVLCAVALSSHFEEQMVTSISFGCPKTGNRAWKEYVDSIPNVGVWRLVNMLDLVPRMPNINYKHVGHTVQLGRKDTRAYWLHEGDFALGYRGVPVGWSSSAYVLTPMAAYDHVIGNYIKYLAHKSIPNEERYYINKFENVNDILEENDEDYEENMDEDEKTRISEEYALRYLEYMSEHGTSNGYNVEMTFDGQLESVLSMETM